MQVFRQILWSPVWLAQVLGMSKSFRDNPVLGSPLLNRMGLHVVRRSAAHALNRLRLFTLAPLVPSEYRREYFRRRAKA